MVQPTPGSRTSLTREVVREEDVRDDLNAHDKEIYFSLFGGGDTTIINEGVGMFDERGEFFVVDGKLYRSVTLDVLMNFLKELGDTFTITERTADPFRVIWDKVIVQLGRMNL